MSPNSKHTLIAEVSKKKPLLRPCITAFTRWWNTETIQARGVHTNTDTIIATLMAEAKIIHNSMSCDIDIYLHHPTKIIKAGARAVGGLG